MTISNRMLLALLFLVAGLVALSMYFGMRLGLEAAKSSDVPSSFTAMPATAGEPTPAAAPTPATASPAPSMSTDECAWLLAAANGGDAESWGVGGGGSGSEGEVSTEEGDFATNSGVVDGSQFNDGGFGDIGQQWWGVTVSGHVTNVNVSDNSSAAVAVGTDQVPAAPSSPASSPALPVVPAQAPVEAPTQTPAPAANPSATAGPEDSGVPGGPPPAG